MEQRLEWLSSEENADAGENAHPRTIASTIFTYIEAAGGLEVIKQYDFDYTKEDMTQERIDEYLNTLENTTEHITIAYARLYPIYEIIEEEAEYYFSDIKSLEEVVGIINSRVGMYVGEGH